MKFKLFILSIFSLISYMAPAKSPGNLNLGRHEIPENLIEKNKSQSFSYTLNASEKIRIDNHFGDVKIKLWNKEMITVKVLITANAPTEEKVNDFLKIVEIATKKSGNEIAFETTLHCAKSNCTNNVSSGDDEENNFLRVDYMIFMPAGHNLALHNSHGDVYIPAFNDVLTLHQKYGNLFADHLTNKLSKIDVKFGKAYIKSMTGGELSSFQSTLVMDKASDLLMTNSCGQVNLLEANNINMNVTYTKGYVAKVNESCDFQIKYSKAFRLGEIMADVSELTIKSEYTNLQLPLCPKGHMELTADTKNAEFIMDETQKVKYLNNPQAARKHMLIGNTDNPTNTKVDLVADFGTIEIK